MEILCNVPKIVVKDSGGKSISTLLRDKKVCDEQTSQKDQLLLAWEASREEYNKLIDLKSSWEQKDKDYERLTDNIHTSVWVVPWICILP